jgi:hypothetical protein
MDTLRTPSEGHGVALVAIDRFHLWKGILGFAFSKLACGGMIPLSSARILLMILK